MRVELGLGAAEVLASPGRGRVVGVYTKAAYLRLPAGLVALTTVDVPAGPIHARTPLRSGDTHAGWGRHERHQFDGGGLRVGDPVVLTGSSLRAGPFTVDLAAAHTWRGELPSASALAAATPLALALLESVPPLSLETEPDPELLQLGDLRAVAAQLGGRGPGLTPAGDDCLAGVLLIAHILWAPEDAPDLAAVAASVPTNDIALAFLRWAARGQSIEPVHRFLTAAARHDATTARYALDALVRFGHSSGADLAAGLRAAVQWLCNGVGAR